MTATPAWPPKSAPRLFVAQALAAGAHLMIEGPQAHYLSRVMRVGEGDAVVLCDDVTGEWAALVVAADKRSVELIAETLLRPREEVPDFTLCAALLKKDRFDLVLEKACELGVRSIQPVLTRRCVADKLNLERARSILIEAAEQCARTALPELLAPVKLEALLKAWPGQRALFFADENGGENAAQAFVRTESPQRRGPHEMSLPADRGPRLRGDSPPCAALLTGPEGGFDEAERSAIRALPQTRAITLGPRVLRGETAALAGISLWMGTVGDW